MIQSKLLRLLRDEEVLTALRDFPPAKMLLVFSRKEEDVFTGEYKK